MVMNLHNSQAYHVRSPGTHPDGAIPVNARQFNVHKGSTDPLKNHAHISPTTPINIADNTTPQSIISRKFFLSLTGEIAS